MRFPRRLPLLFAALFTATGCPNDEDCPEGFVCFPTGTDTGTTPPDTGIDPKDSGPADTGDNPPDTGAPDTGVTPGAAVLSASFLDFGTMVVGREVSRTVDLSNPTSADVIVTVGSVSGLTSRDFSVEANVTITGPQLTLTPGQVVTFTVYLRRSQVGRAHGEIFFELCDGGCPAMVTLMGEGIQDAISCGPTSIDFGYVNPGTCGTQAVTCANNTTYDETILDIGLEATSAPAFAVSTAAPPIVLAAAASHTFDVTYCPQAFTPVEAGTVEVEVDHPDPSRTTIAIPLTGDGGGPDIACAPGAVDLGIIGVGQTAIRTVICENVGDEILTVASADLSAGTTADLMIVASTGTISATFPVALDPGETLVLDVVYDASATGSHTSTLEISSDDPDAPLVDIDVDAAAVDTTGCALTASPVGLAIDFGTIALGLSQNGNFRFENTGTGPCAITVIGVSAATPAAFQILTTAQAAVLAAGATFDIGIVFAPTIEQAYSGEIFVQTSDPIIGSAVLGLAGAGALVPITLALDPPAIDFGSIGVGCAEPVTRPLQLNNVGATDLTVTITVETGSPEFAIGGTVTSTTIVVPARSTVQLPIGFLPGVVGTFMGRLRVETASIPGAMYVDLTGQGTASSANTVTYLPTPVARYDVLLIVDDSGSMSEEQAAIIGAAQQIINVADASGADYHIAVTTTDPGDSGYPAGQLRGPPSVITSQSPTRLQDLQFLIDAGTNGSGNERGLFTAAQAVSDPALLAGTNAGFLRPDGNLVVIIFSDEEEGSFGVPEQDYVAIMANRPVGQPGVRIYTVTGGVNGCPTASQSTRYPAAAALTGGFDRSICETDYTQLLTEIFTAAFVDTRAYVQLGATPVNGSVTVTIDGVPIQAMTGTTTHWAIDFTQARVVFPLGEEPAPTSTVEIGYIASCTLITCGNTTIETPEQCDDGINGDNTDGCLDSCYTPFCGDTFAVAPEQCDDGNNVTGDGCNGTCTVEGCGNGIPEPPEECDLGAGNSDTAPDTCRTTCLNPFCQDGVQDTGEACDDGNASDNDDCVLGCVAAFCGDGLVNFGQEACDDGNMIDNDLCNNACAYNIDSFTVAITPNVPLVPAVGGTPITFSSTDDGQAAVPIGFPFLFLGVAITDIHVGTNGLISADPNGVSSLGNTTFPNAGAPNAMVAWFWDDLHVGRPTNPAPLVTTQLTGVAPNRVRVITFANFTHFSGGGALFTAEIRLVETTNVIETHYGQSNPVNPAPAPYSASVGWESAQGVVGANVLACTPACNGVDWPEDTVITYTP